MHGNEVNGIVAGADKAVQILGGFGVGIVVDNFHREVEAFLYTGVAAEDRVVNNVAGFGLEPVIAGLTVGCDNAEGIAAEVLGFNAVVNELTCFQRVGRLGNSFGDGGGIRCARIGCGGVVTAAGGHDSGDKGQSREKKRGNAGLFHGKSPYILWCRLAKIF